MQTRILSAAVMIAIFVPVLLIGGGVFAFFVALLAVLGLYELLHMREVKKEFPIMMKVFAYLMVLFFCLNNMNSIDFVANIDYKVMTFIIFLFLIPMVLINDNKKYNINDALFLVGSTLFIGMSFNLLMIVRNNSLEHIIYLFLITIMTDTFAYFTGLLIGKHKLIEKISPKKTVEGLIGGTLMATIVASTYYHVAINSSLSLSILILITIALSLFGQFGDLVFSAIKRYYNQKDFSNLIPGHGGILDRLDSIIFVVLAFVLYISWL